MSLPEWPEEKIPNEDHVFRQIHFSDWDKSSGRKIPLETHFIPDDDGLSVNWSKYCTFEYSFVLIGLSHNKKNNFIRPSDFKVLKFIVEILRSFEFIEDVLHNPQFHGEPPPIGIPNNRGHSLVKYPNDEGIRLLLCEYVHNNYNDVICRPDFGEVEKEVAQMKEKYGW